MLEPSGTSVVRPSLSKRLQDVTELLAAAQTQDDVFDVVLKPALEAVGAISAVILLLSSGGGQLVHTATHAPEQYGGGNAVPPFWQGGPLDSRLPTGEAIARNAPLFFEHAGALTTTYPALKPGLGAVPPVATAILPMFEGERALGVLVLDFREPHQFTGDEKRFLRTLSAQCGIALSRARLTANLQQQLHTRTSSDAGDAAAEALAYEALMALTETTDLSTDPLGRARQAVQLLQRHVASSRVVYAEATDSESEEGAWKARVWSDTIDSALLRGIEVGLSTSGTVSSPMASSAPVTMMLHTRRPVFVDADPTNPADGTCAYFPLVMGRSMVSSTAVGSPGNVRGLLSVSLDNVPKWQGADRTMIRAVGRGLQVALERAEHARQLEEEQAALDAFLSFAEASALTTDVQSLAGRAAEVLCTTLGAVSVVYYVLEGEVWKAKVWSPGVEPDVLAALQAGIPTSAPSFAEVSQTREAVFVARWQAAQDGVQEAQDFGAVALYPLFLVNAPHGLLTMGTQRATDWTDRERRVFRAVGRSLALALERAEQTQRLELQNAELGARTRALEVFADPSLGLSPELDRSVLIRRAQEVVLSRLPEGYAAYYEPEGGLWRERVRTGDGRTSGQLGGKDAEFPDALLHRLERAWNTLQPFYQGAAAGQSVNTGETASSATSTLATLRLDVNGEAAGVMAFVLSDARPWTALEKVVVETVVRNLGLALERADSVAHLAARTREVTEWRERYEVAVRGSGHLLYDWNPQTDVILYGGAVAEITGYQPHELAGHLSDWTERLVHPDDRARFSVEISRVIEENDEFHLAFRVIRSDGSVRHVEDDGYLMRGEDGQLTRMVGFLKDVTEQKRAAGELRRVSRFNELILNNVGDGLTGVDLEGRTSFANPAALALLGYEPHELIGLPQHALIHHTHADGSAYPRSECPIYAAFTDGQTKSVQDEVFWRKDGTSFPVEYTSTPIRNEAGKIEGAVLAFRDVSERHRTQQALQHSNTELLRSNAELEQFAYVASHDLQEPLRTVTSFAQLLVNRYSGQLDAKADTYIRMITGGTDRMAQLLQDLLTFSRVTSETQFATTLDTAALMTQVVQDLHDQIARTGARVTVGPLPPVVGDVSQLRQVFQNLLGNALKFSAPDQLPEVSIEAAHQDGWVQFSVRDNGIGIAPEFFDRIFTIFQRLHSRDEYEGNGIGLSITRKIVERHGGRLWLDSNVGQGTVFSFTLPAGV
ncbi:PAS domain S-box protein [Deinococcus sp. Arct2-2]|uniref:PAS domain S-box protein n=1 Tax=Deinococcus sp. Arct2-2 TaxID=2568653 RepID=UPI0010A3BD8F|nr:PAS domain S-box protein [Deinococcus sp. Arct2-2]THF70255.1 PAS domain S-box protein [Deinococcus sp. Arct2-2]